ncbi:membrane fusion protein [Rhizobium sp. NFR07]|uniref:HlyD family type I secretion periplasmic adaptor subunit n=1 Tax=Rhizobium sp. NFR07 TaxID=1566262 RepID=UPI0008F2FE76|nr:HlyD family type I secretion periplasmic adaptor subunit [Rhizobium sp. NFR07]SFB51049.1 membrane fusion protein [Rhizobium sp. NFR07]
MTALPPSEERSLVRHSTAAIALCLFVFAGGAGWAATMSISSAAIAHGLVAVEHRVKKIQHALGGNVSEVLVTEGAIVNQGDVLIRLDGATVRANLAVVSNTVAQLTIRQARARAQLVGSTNFLSPSGLGVIAEADAINAFQEVEQSIFRNKLSSLNGMKSQLRSRDEQLREQLNALDVRRDASEKQVAILQSELTSAEALLKKGLGLTQRASALAKDLADVRGTYGETLSRRAEALAKQAEVGLQLLQLDEDYRSSAAQELAQIMKELTEAQDKRIAIVDQLDRLDIRAPVSGKVHQLNIHARNEVVEEGVTLMLLVPLDEKLIVDAKVEASLVDKLSVGQDARLRFPAFDQRVSPEVLGSVLNIAPDSVVDERTGQNVYPVQISLSARELDGLPLHPGMPAEVFFSGKSRTVMSYLIKPLTDQMQHVFRYEH